MNNAEFLSYTDKTLDDMKAMIKAKNADYTNGEGAFANFEMTEKLGLSDAKTGLLIRMVDKIQRLKSFIAKGDLQVKGESAQDAAKDILGYALVLSAMLAKPRSLVAPPRKGHK